MVCEDSLLCFGMLATIGKHHNWVSECNSLIGLKTVSGPARFCGLMLLPTDSELKFEGGTSLESNDCSNGC
eukprot:m.256906 g.256906  ORF g.256906 m.256906 type:complete len:71 (-) comp17578_c0_seq3:1353-1565(-)